ncbi:uncharacterized protein EMH_0062790 [Eimeria mitis]|uniref:GINS subunit domain-containing protein n=1 Tax=Eimeria mitis TaxID=44415 RepID=U6KDZ2_9EIME|nr:uncharacterized protein EMH_0062790 [Eimeria mitis]CDJ34447.1 hypothetical protein, conserved [Eimeria mitis]
MPEEVRLLQQADVITDYPTHLLRAAEEELKDYYQQLQKCNAFLNNLSSETSAEEIEAVENRRFVLELDVLHALRVLKVFQQTRQHLLDKMSVKVLGQFDAFDEQTLLKLSDHEKQYLRDACAAEHSRRDELNARNVEDKNGKPSAIADVVFEKECLLEDPWHFRLLSSSEEAEAAAATAAAAAAAGCSNFSNCNITYVAKGTVRRLPLYRAVQLQAKGIAKVLQVTDHQWLHQDSAAFQGLI